jgi:pimeloyl-ACP methyl ester carboxylesterase
MSALDFHPAWIIGHSMGARTAAALAYLKPEWTQGLILVDLGFDGLAGGGLGQSLAEFIRILPERFASRAEARQFMEAHCPDGSIAQYLMAVSVALPEDQGGGITFPFDHAALIQTIEAARGTTIRHWIENASERGIPTLALRGEQSRVWSAEDFAREKAYFSAPRWRGLVRLEEVAGAGHGLPFEKRSAFLEHLYRIV